MNIECNAADDEICILIKYCVSKRQSGKLQRLNVNLKISKKLLDSRSHPDPLLVAGFREGVA